MWFCTNSTTLLAQETKVKSAKLGLMVDGLQADELKAIQEFVVNQQELESVIMNESLLTSESINNLGLTHLWIHQLSGNNSSYENSEVGESVKKYVKNGGNLILSMDAVKLLNAWGIEKNTLEVKSDSITDDGFGRPLGFHAFKSHPVFDGMNGGAYPWKSKKDHVVRKIGFFGDNVPDENIAKVIGIEWTYITFHENNKLVLEYKLGKGKIIAVGAFSYFAKENYNTEEFHRFYSNTINYLSGDIKDVDSNYWTYKPQKVKESNKKLQALNLSEATKWNLPDLTINLQKEEATDAGVLMTGRRMVIGGFEKGGIEEIWTNPFMAFRDIETGVLLKGSDSIVWLNKLVPSINSSPELLIREYRISATDLKEVTTVSMDNPVGIVHYEWEGTDISKIVMKYTSNLRYMWPYSEKITGTISYNWSPEMNAVVSEGQYGDLASIMGFSTKPESHLLGQNDGFSFENGKFSAIKTDLIQVSGIFTFDAQSVNGNLNAYMVAGDAGVDNAIAMYKNESENFNKPYLRSSAYYRNLIDNSLMLTTPDEKFNTGYRWALVRTDQFFQETPSIGTTMVAGLGTTSRGWDGNQKVNGRPGYSWYFGRDAQWCGFAVNAYGGHEMVKKILDVFEKYQGLNGKIFHELTTSGVVHFDASDSSPLYLVLAAHYLKYSGNIEYIEKLWPSLKKAMDFCYATDTDNDGLIEITNVGHGWVESGSLFDRLHTGVYLAGTWAAALDAASYITAHLDQSELSETYKKDAESIRKTIDKDFWNKEGEYFYTGKMIDGTYLDQESVLSGVPIYFDAITNEDKAYKTAQSYSSNLYSTDWGVRILPETSKRFNPGSYFGGMVWPLFSGWASLAEYRTGNYASAYSHIMNNLLIYRDWNMGSVEETLHGSIYKPEGVCGQQGWSETMVLLPISEGMLGLKPDALANKVSLAPRFPWDWDEVKVDNVLFGNHKIDFKMTRTTKSTVFNFQENLETGSIMNFTPAFPLGTIITKVTMDGKSVKFDIVNTAESVNLAIEGIVVNDQTKVEISHKKGIGAIPIVNLPEIGATNKGAKIVQQKLTGKNFEVVLEGRPNSEYQFKVMSNVKVKSVTNGRIVEKQGEVYTIETKIPESTEIYMKQRIFVKLK